MIYALEKEKIEKCWNIIEEGVKLSLPPALLREKGSMNNVKEALLKGDLLCWMIAGKTHDDIRAVCITATVIDVGTKTRNLLIYALYAYEIIPKEVWYEGILMLRKFAKDINCKYIVAYSNNGNVISIAEKLKGTINMSFIMFDV